MGLTVQPILAIVGEIKSISAVYVIVDDVQYKIETPLKGLDVTFKAYHALCAKYPVEAEHVWSFVQKMIYDINTEYDSKYVSVNTLMSDLKSL